MSDAPQTSASTPRTVLVTGTSTGIGLEAALAAARAGWRVVATMRDPGRSQRLLLAAQEAGVEVEVRELDVTLPRSVAECVDAVVRDHGRLDAVLNNAGAAHVGTVEVDDMEAIRACLEVNFFGVLTVTRAALPHLRASRGRVVTVTSVGGVVGQPFNEAYCAAKFAVEGFMESLCPVAAAVGVGIAVVEPGAVASEFIANAGLDPASLLASLGPYAAAASSYLERTSSTFSGAQSPAEAGEAVAALLDADPLPFRTQTSDAARAFVGVKLGDLDGAAVQALTSSWVASAP